MTPRVIAVAIEKGGNGKTTTVVNLAYLFAEKKQGKKSKRVLVIDADPQANTTLTLTGKGKTEWTGKGVFDLVKTYGVESVSLDNFVFPTKYEGIDIIPGNIHTKQLGSQLRVLSSQYGEDTYKFLKERIAPIIKDYEIVLFDTPPAQDDVAVSALYASTDLLMPVIADKYSKEGLLNTLALVNSMEKKEQIAINILGIIFIRAERTILQDVHRSNVQSSDLADLLFSQEIRKGQAVVDSIEEDKPVVLAYPKSNPAKDYRALYTEIVKRLEGK